MSNTRPATPEGGQPADDELLARHDEMMAMVSTMAMVGAEAPSCGAWIALAGDLASALRRQLAETDRMRRFGESLDGSAASYQAEALRWRHESQRLERELAEARDEVDRWKGDAKQYAQKAERWHESYDRVLAQSRTRSQALGRLERESAVARSRGEVLAVVQTRRSTVPGESPLPGVYVPAEPGTEVLVVRADQEMTP